MALSATVSTFRVELADIDRGVYDSFEQRVAQHPSETTDYLLTRVLAFALEFTDGIAFTRGVSTGDEPAIVVRDATGDLRAWIEVGAPPAERLHRGSKAAARTALYTHRPIAKVLAGYAGKTIHGRESIPVHAFEPAFIERAAAAIGRRNRLALTVNERQLLLDINGELFDSESQHHALG